MEVAKVFFHALIKDIEEYDERNGYTNDPNQSFFFDRHATQVMTVWELRVKESGTGSRFQFQHDSPEYQQILKGLCSGVDSAVDKLITIRGNMPSFGWRKDDDVQKIWREANLDGRKRRVDAESCPPGRWTSASRIVRELPNPLIQPIGNAFQLGGSI